VVNAYLSVSIYNVSHAWFFHVRSAYMLVWQYMRWGILRLTYKNIYNCTTRKRKKKKKKKSNDQPRDVGQPVSATPMIECMTIFDLEGKKEGDGLAPTKSKIWCRYIEHIYCTRSMLFAPNLVATTTFAWWLGIALVVARTPTWSMRKRSA